MRKVALIKMIIKSGKDSPVTQFIIISGPTASGKTNLAIHLAKIFETEIISFDSRQFYAELTIGTAKPSPQQLREIKHHFIGHKSIHEEYNAETFSKEARILIQDLTSRLPYIILVGGSGLFLNSLLYSFDFIPAVDKSVRQMLIGIQQKEGIEALQALLHEKDPDYYNLVDLRNPQRIIRALEVCLSTQKTFSSFRTGKKEAINGKFIKIGLDLPTEILYPRINDRVDYMIQNGLVEEAQNYFEFRHLNSLKTVGYTELFEFFENRISLDEAVSKIKQHTRNFAKRQVTWFKKDKDNVWMAPDQEKLIIHYIRNCFLPF